MLLAIDTCGAVGGVALRRACWSLVQGIGGEDVFGTAAHDD